MPTRSTWIIGHHSPIVGEIPATCARVRNGPRPRTVSARRAIASVSVTSATAVCTHSGPAAYSARSARTASSFAASRSTRSIVSRGRSESSRGGEAHAACHARHDGHTGAHRHRHPRPAGSSVPSQTRRSADIGSDSNARLHVEDHRRPLRRRVARPRREAVVVRISGSARARRARRSSPGRAVRRAGRPTRAPCRGCRRRTACRSRDRRARRRRGPAGGSRTGTCAGSSPLRRATPPRTGCGGCA